LARRKSHRTLRHATKASRLDDMTNGRRALNWFLMLTATGLALITMFTFAARLWWAFDLFSHFRVQYVVASLVLAMIALAARAYPSVAVLAAVALVHGAQIKDLWLGSTAGAASGGVPLRVVSANVLSQNRTPEKVLEFVRAADADLVLLIDAGGREWREILGQLRDLYPHQAQRAWLSRARINLYSRWPIISEEVREAPRSQRPYLVAKLAIEDRTLEVVGVHPSSPSPSEPGKTRRRNRELDHIADVAKDTDAAVIVAGDFNTTPWSPHFKDLLAAAGLRNAAEGKGYIPTWPTWFWPARIPIDHVLFKGPIAVTTVRRGPAVGSDHFPIIADLRLTGSPWD
jgi:endonuclease/exonuclease/phosphatase (EEP) superfamily protein YafD